MAGKPGRPRKTTKFSNQENATESSENVESNEVLQSSKNQTEEPSEANEANNEVIVSAVDLSNEVDRLIKLIEGYTPTFNREQKMSVVNLGAPVGDGQGVRFKQLFVEESVGFMTISLKDGFKSNHGGQIQRKTLNSFRVPVSDPHSYARLQARFFGFNQDTNYNDADLLLNAVDQSLTNS